MTTLAVVVRRCAAAAWAGLTRRCATASWVGLARRRAPVLVAALLAATLACEGEPAGPDQPEPVAVVIEDGNRQAGRVGATLPVELRVRVVDQSGAPVAGATVEFRPGAGSGAVAVATATTDSRGVASAGTWTLGPLVGEQRVEAVATEAPEASRAVFVAVAADMPVAVRIAAGQDQRAQVGTRLPIRPEVLVLNASGAPVAGVHVAFATSSGALVGAQAVTGPGGRAAVGGWTLGTTSGVQELVAAVAGEGVEGNPAVFRALADPGPPLQMHIVQGDGQQVEAGFPATVAPQLRVEDEHGNPVPGVRVLFQASGGGSVEGAEQTTGPDGSAAPDAWIGAAEAGTTQTLTATATAPTEFAGASVTFSAVAFAPFFDVRIVHTSASRTDETTKAAFARAEARWEAAIRGNLPPVPVVTELLAECEPNVEHPSPGFIDDLHIFVTVRDIDGAGGIFGAATPCFVRLDSGLPFAGYMVFDAADINALTESESLESAILHEMGHVLGFGTLWRTKGLLRNPADSSDVQIDTHFAGERAVARFDRAGGAEYGTAKVPVEHVGITGARNVHWRESVFDAELMSAILDAGTPKDAGTRNPLSEITIASLEDLGYHGVDYSVADPYRLPAQPQAVAGAQPRKPNARPPARSRRFEFVDHIPRIPIGVVDARGQIVRYIQPTGTGPR